MAIKYVEDYRLENGSTLSDTDTIQAAVNSLEDGDTLLFNKKGVSEDNEVIPGTYILAHPIHFTKCNMVFDENGKYDTTGGRNIHSVTIDGCGCKIINGSGFNDQKYKKFLFVLSDKGGHGMIDSVIKNFVFEYAKSVDSTADDKNFTAIGPTGNVDRSTYIYRCTISNCEFYFFSVGVYFCGDENTVANCLFNNCTKGIDADCPNHSSIHSNRFEAVYNSIFMTKPFWCTVHDNFIFKTRSHAITVDGTYENEVYNNDEMRQVLLSIYSNIITGGTTTETVKDENTGEEIEKVTTYNQGGIYIDGVTDLIVKDNFIYDMDYRDGKDIEKIPYSTNYGIGIYINGRNTYNGTEYIERYSKRCIISGNNINKCMSCGIKTNYSYDCLFTDNIIFRDTGIVHSDTDTGNEMYDYGIYVDTETFRHKISSNVLYNFDNGNGIFRYAGTTIRTTDNTTFAEEFRTFEGTIYADYTDAVLMPSTITLKHEEVFCLKIPENYSCLTVSYIRYMGQTGSISKRSDGSLVNLSQYAGQTVKLQYLERTSSLSGDSYIEFLLID